MAKYISMEGSYCTDAMSLAEVEQLRETALSFASQGAYALAIKFLKIACTKIPSMPTNHASHTEAMEKIRGAMEHSLHNRIKHRAQILREKIYSIARNALDGDESPDEINQLTSTHVNEMELLCNLSMALTYMRIFTNYMHGENEIIISRLEQLEEMFTSIQFE